MEYIHTLIGKYLSGNATEEETNRLNEWRKRRSENEEEFKEIEKVWSNALDLKLTKNYNADAGWEDFMQRAMQKSGKHSRHKVIKIAASFIFLLIAGVIIKLLLTMGANKPQPHIATKKITAPALKTSTSSATTTTLTAKNSTYNTIAENALLQEKTIIKNQYKPIVYTTGDSAIAFLLPDSTEVYLNSKSTLSYLPAFGKKERRVKLLGEAFFNVQHLATPFIVVCNKTLVHDIGTSFNVKGLAKDSLVEVSVITGSIEFSDENQPGISPMLITEGNTGIYHAGSALFEKAKNRKGQKWWKTKKFKHKIRDFFDNLKPKKKN